jgi:hypothetical protein
MKALAAAGLLLWTQVSFAETLKLSLREAIARALSDGTTAQSRPSS